MQVSGYNNSFVSGEISEEAWERSDLEQVATGCEEASNMIGAITGPNVSRGGFYRRGAPKFQASQQALFSWNRPDGEGLVLEFGELYARVWTARGAVIETTPGSGTPYEFAHGYSASDLAGLRIKQVGDIGFITSRYGLLATQIQRRADNDWTAAVQALKNGPWLAENSDETQTLTFTSLGGGSWQIDCTGASWTHWSVAHIGAQILARPPGGGPGLKTWAPNTAYVAGENIISVGRIYATTAGGTTGNTPPSHEAGEVSDGVVLWDFQHDGATAFQITAFTSPTQVIATALGVPPFVTGTATPNWSDQAISDAEGYPTALVAVREERLALAATLKRPDVIEFSRTAGFTPAFADFKPGLGTGLTVDDDACRVQLGDNRARIVWMIEGIVFAVGTTDAEWVVAGATIDDPISPASVKARRVSSHGSADVMPLVVQGPPSLILHVAKGGTVVRELTLGGGGDQASAGRDLSVLGQHVYGRGVAGWAWSRPDNNIWMQLRDGGLACLTYHAEHGVLGVRRQPIAGGFAVESLATASDPDGQDVLHVAAVRFKGGAPQRAHFTLAPRRDGMFLDCADFYEGAPATVISGLAHLEGETVSVLADGAFVGGLIVTGGTITLPAAASEVFVGLAMLRRFKTLPFDPDRQGNPLAKKSRPSHVYVVLGCVEAKIQSQSQDEPDERYVPTEDVIQRRSEDTVPVVRRKRAKVFLGGGADRDVRVIIETDKPYDLSIYAIRPLYEAA
jgi:hypothetical protein